jgi:hypothetical protein
MSLGAKRVAGLIVLAACLAAPILEAFDRWDEPYSRADNTETALVVLALAIGVTLLISPLPSHRLRQTGRSASTPAPILSRSLRGPGGPLAPACGTGPPTILRV